MVSKFSLLLAVALPVSAFAFTDYSQKCTNEAPCAAIVPLNPAVDLPDQGTYVSWTTVKGTDERMAKSTGKFTETYQGKEKKAISIDPSKTYQKIIGFGGALTDAAALNYRELSPSQQQRFLEAYYGPTGLEYTLGRVPMGSTDFSLGEYNYNNEQNDYSLETFDISVDSDLLKTGDKLGFVKEALAYTKRPVRLFTSPWSPPAWMTDQNTTVHNPTLRADPETQTSWALYFTKFLEAYSAEGVDFWGLTLQNEPLGNTGAWQDLKFSADTMLSWARDYFGPHFQNWKKAGGDERDVKVMMLDDQRTHLKKWSDKLLDPANGVPDFIDGVGLHWYAEVNEKFVTPLKSFQHMEETAEKYPTKFLLATEACNGYIPILDQGPRLGKWSRGELYGFDVLHDVASYAGGWTDWNLALSMEGGPNWANNVVDAPILIDGGSDAFYRNPMFWYLGHFSKFVTPGMERVESVSTCDGFACASMEQVAFSGIYDEENGGTEKVGVLVVLNRDIHDHEFEVVVGGGRVITGSLGSHGIQTIVWRD